LQLRLLEEERLARLELLTMEKYNLEQGIN